MKEGEALSQYLLMSRFHHQVSGGGFDRTRGRNIIGISSCNAGGPALYEVAKPGRTPVIKSAILVSADTQVIEGATAVPTDHW